MIDIVAYYIGYIALAAGALFLAACVILPIYWAFTALLDVLSQYYLLWREKRAPAEGVTFGQAFTSSFGWQEEIWGRIWYRLKRAHGFPATHPRDRTMVD